MRPRRTPVSNAVFRLEGGTEDNDLWVCVGGDGREAIIQSVWDLTKTERERIARGDNIVLTVFGTAHPPVTMGVTTIKPGRKKPK